MATEAPASVGAALSCYGLDSRFRSPSQRARALAYCRPEAERSRSVMGQRRTARRASRARSRTRTMYADWARALTMFGNPHGYPTAVACESLQPKTSVTVARLPSASRTTRVSPAASAAGRVGREVAHVCTSNVRAGDSGGTGRCRRRVMPSLTPDAGVNETKSGCSRKLGWRSSLCAPSSLYVETACRAEPAFGGSEGRSRAHLASQGRRLMGAAGCRGAFGVTLQFALALSTRGFCNARRELNLAHRRRQAPRLLGPVQICRRHRIVASSLARRSS